LNLNGRFMPLPSVFTDRLTRILPPSVLDLALASFDSPDVVSFRINTLKITVPVVLERLALDGLFPRPVPWIDTAFVLDVQDRPKFVMHPLTSEGAVYIQALSSMIPAVILAPHEGEVVLDACAAPGSKTSQMAMMMNNKGRIMAIEAVKSRLYKLKSVCSLLGVTNVEMKFSDTRRVKFEEEIFDRVLVDAPCSSEGRFKSFDKKSVGYWSPHKIKEMSHKQKGILLNASRGLKAGGVLVYSTCTFAPEENEEVVDWFLRKTKMTFVLEDASIDGITCYPCLKEWNGRGYAHDVSLCTRILPREGRSGFFVAKLRRAA
jgi:NOL1/NOP2/sun family putative RNA methylase